MTFEHGEDSPKNSKYIQTVWGVSPCRVNYYCAAGRIPGAVKMATIWLIPKQAVKPPDGRRKRGDDENGEKNSAG